MRTLRFRPRAVLPSLLAVVALAGGCSRKQGGAPAPRTDAAVPVLLRAVRTQAVPVEVDVVGTLWGDEDTTIAAKVPGRVIAVAHDVGDRVAAGDVLAQVESIDYSLAVEQKQLAVRESLAKIALRELPAADFDPVDVPLVQRAKLLVANAQSRFDRTRQLFEQKPPRVTLEDFDDAKTAWEVARSNWDVELLSARAVIDEARTRAADLAIATERLADTTLRAPGAAGAKVRSYAVAARMVSVGEYVKEGAPLFRLVDDDLIKLRAAVPERHANEIAIGQKVRLTVAASAEEFEGDVARINPQVDPANRSFDVEVVVRNERHLLRPGAFARARILIRVDPRIVFVPQEAIVSFAGVNKLFVVEEGKAKEIDVEPGERDGDWVAVHEGLDGSESVVVSGTTKLATGVAVVAETAADAKPAVESDAKRDGP